MTTHLPGPGEPPAESPGEPAAAALPAAAPAALPPTPAATVPATRPAPLLATPPAEPVAAPATPSAPLAPVATPKARAQRLHPLPIRIMHWTNAVAIFIMIGSGWKIYDDDPIFGWLHFADAITIGRWAQHGLQWHFFGMWIFVVNGLCYLSYGLSTGRYRRMLLPVRWRELMATVADALRFRLAHDDPTRYNAVQKLLYIGVICAGLVIVTSGLAIWKPVQFSSLVTLLGGFQTARLIHFAAMAGIFGFVLVHLSLAILVPHTIVGMVAGGPFIKPEPDVPAASETAT